MNPDPNVPTTVEEFLRWDGGGDFRWELVNGEAVRLPRDGTRAHMRTIMSLAGQLWSNLPASDYCTGISLLAVRTSDGIRMPDLVVDRHEDGDGTELTASAPILIAEVLSEWSRDRDLGEKLDDYQRIGSLRHYIVLEADEAKALHWYRTPGMEWSDPLVHGDEPFSLEFLGVSVCAGRPSLTTEMSA